MMRANTIYPGYAVARTLTDPWPEGVAFRALTVGWATADVVDVVTAGAVGAAMGAETHVLSAHCTGHGCPWKAGGGHGWTFTFYAIDTTREYTRSRFDLQRQAQRHAEECRAMARPVQ